MLTHGEPAVARMSYSGPPNQEAMWSSQVEAGQPDRREERWRDVPLDAVHAHLLLEYDERVLPLSNLIEAIESAAATVVDIRNLRADASGRKAVLVTIDTQDIRPVVLRLAGYPLLRLEGYNARAGNPTP
jgi:hypothetical protein